MPVFFYDKVTAAKLTQAIVDKGDVRVSFNSGSSAYPVPNPALPGLYYKFSAGAIEIFSPTK